MIGSPNNQRRTLLRHILILVIALSHAEVQAGSSELAALQKLHNSTTNSVSPISLLTAAQHLGPIVTRLSDQGTTLDELLSARAEVVKLDHLASCQRESMERSANENEAALARLFGSTKWDDAQLTFSLLRYWLAWIDVELAKAEPQAERWLEQAEQGFQLASLQLFHPNIAYGGWIGRGTVLLLRGDERRASEVFTQVAELIANGEQSPESQRLLSLVRLQQSNLGVVFQGKLTHPESDLEADALRSEALTLMASESKEPEVLKGIQLRLNLLVSANEINVGFIQQLLANPEHLVRLSLDPWSELAAAEIRFRNKDFKNAGHHYRLFFNSSALPQTSSIAPYRYRWAFAAYQHGSYQETIVQLNVLLRRADQVADTAPDAAKMLYLAHAALQAQNSSAGNRKALDAAAKRFITTNPNDVGVGEARLLLAQLDDSLTSALSMLGPTGANKNDIAAQNQRFDLVWQSMNKLIERGRWNEAVVAIRAAAKDVRLLTSHFDLDSARGALAVQMLTALDPEPSVIQPTINILNFRILAASVINLERRGKHIDALALGEFSLERFNKISEIAQQESTNRSLFETMNSLMQPAGERPEINTRVYEVSDRYNRNDIKAALLWSQLYLHKQSDEWDDLLAKVEQSILLLPGSWQTNLLFPWLPSIDDVNHRLRLAKTLLATNPEVSMDRRLRSLVVNALLTQGKQAQAYREARLFVELHKGSGNAWQALATAADAQGRPAEAYKAWQQIGQSAEPEQDIWWESMLSRIKLQAKAEEFTTACRLLHTTGKMDKLLPPVYQDEYQSILESGWCEPNQP